MILPGQRAIAVGKTGSGKSRALGRVFAAWPGQRLLVDVNDDYELGPASEEGGLEVYDGPEKIDWRARTIRYVPKWDSHEEYDRLYRAIFNRGNLLVWLDEAEGPTTSSRTPPALRKTITQGRKRGITHLAATQRPVGVDPRLRNQAEHGYFFDLGNDHDDIEAVAYRLGIDWRTLRQELEQLPPHGFFYHELGAGNPVQREPPMTEADLRLIDQHVLMP